MRALGHWYFLFKQLTLRDLQSRYAGSALGFAWPILQPLAQLALFSFVFSVVIRIPLVGEGTDSFPLFLFAGLAPFLGFQEAVVRGAAAIQENATLIGRVRVPGVLLVISRVASAAILQMVSLLAFVPFVAAAGVLRLDPAALLIAVLAMIAELALAAGLGLGLAAITVFARDLGQVLPIALSAWFYLTPIVYPGSLVPADFRGLVGANPLAAVVAAHRAVLVGSPLPALAPIAIAIGAGVAACGVGALIFVRLEASFSDEA